MIHAIEYMGWLPMLEIGTHISPEDLPELAYKPLK